MTFLMKFHFWMFLAVLGSPVFAFAEEPKSEEESPPAKVETLPDSMSACTELNEKLDVFKPLQATVSGEFARINDPMLCDSMASQCEYFTTMVKQISKEYKSQCDPSFDVDVEKCDYSKNPCVKKVKEKSFPRMHAGLQ